MGAKTWMIVQADGPVRAIRPVLEAGEEPDPAATAAFVTQCFPKADYRPSGSGPLYDTSPRQGRVVAGCWPGLRLIAHESFAIDHPSRTAPALIAPRGTTVLHVMHSVVDWFAYAVWQDGQLQRALSLNPDRGVIEDIGARLPFEQPFWDGPRTEDEDYPLPFHPLDLGEAALVALFGYQLEGELIPDLLDPAGVTLLHFERQRPWWKLW